MGKEFSRPSLDCMANRMVAGKTIDQTDLDRLIVIDSPPEAIEAITDAAEAALVFQRNRAGLKVSRSACDRSHKFCSSTAMANY